MYRRPGFQFIVAQALCAGALLTLSACGGGDGGSSSSTQPQSTPTVAGTVTKGPLTNATIVVYDLDASGNKGAQLGSASTDDKGQFSVTLSKAPAGAVQIEASAGSYAGESQGDHVTGDTQPCKTIVTSVPAGGIPGISLNPITDMATERAHALASGGQNITDALNQASGEVKQYFGFSVDVMTLKPSFDATLAGSGSTNSDALQLGLLLIALDLFVHDVSSSNPDAVYAALDADFRNGSLGHAQTYGSQTFTTDQFKRYLARKLTLAVSSFANGVPAASVESWAATHPQQAATNGVDGSNSSYYTCDAGMQLTQDGSGNPVCWDGKTVDSKGNPYFGSYYSCGGVAYKTDIWNGKCPDGSIPFYSHSNSSIPIFHAPLIKAFTDADRAAMNAATMASLPSYMTPISGPLNDAQKQAYNMMYSSLSDFYRK